MARTRAQRRRSNLLIAVALVATLVILLFARDINRAAHASYSIERSENRSFASLANDLLSSEASFEFHLGYLLGHGASLSRPVFAARLDQLALVLPTWTTDAQLLRHPGIAHDVNGVLVDLTEQRAADYEVVLATTAGALHLPWTSAPESGLTSVAARSSLLASDHQWEAVRRDLVHEPGAAHLLATSTPSSVVTLPTTLESLASSPSLRLVRGVSISAVAVTPSPLPAPIGRIVLPSIRTFHLGVSVTNDAFVLQPVTLTVTLTPLSGSSSPAQSQSMKVTLGPSRSYAFVPQLFATSPGEHARLTLDLSGSRDAPTATRRRSYLVVLSPAIAVSAAFSTQPGDTTTGVATHASVTVLDGFGNPVAGDVVSISLASGPGGFSASSSLTARTNGSGVATFTKLVLDKPGVYTLTAADGSAVATSNSLTVSGG